MSKTIRIRIMLAAGAMGCCGTAFAHSGGHQGSVLASGFITGFLHPFFGLDHVVAMIAVGLWGGFLGTWAVWTLPVVFPLIMAMGGALGILGVRLPAVETGIALSALILGLAVALAMRPPLWVAAVMVGLFGIFHGYAHGMELPGSTAALPYSVGFVVATGLLHLAGIAFASLGRWRWGEIAVRTSGALIAGCGAWFILA